MSNSTPLIATDADVARTVREIDAGFNAADSGRSTYLRMLIATTQDSLGLKLRERASLGARIKGEEIAQQLDALHAVHKRFYAIVLATFADLVPSGTRGRAVELHRRANFARTALSAVRGYITTGHDLGALAASRATKSDLFVKRTGGKASPQRLSRSLQRRTQGLIEGLAALADADRAAAITEAQAAIAHLATQLKELGVSATKDTERAIEEHRPLRIGGAVFVPASAPVLQ